MESFLLGVVMVFIACLVGMCACCHVGALSGEFKGTPSINPFSFTGMKLKALSVISVILGIAMFVGLVSLGLPDWRVPFSFFLAFLVPPYIVGGVAKIFFPDRTVTS